MENCLGAMSEPEIQIKQVKVDTSSQTESKKGEPCCISDPIVNQRLHNKILPISEYSSHE